MLYKRFDDTVIVRMDVGEEITAQTKKVAELEHIRLASVSALGAVTDFTVGVFKMDEKKFYGNRFQGAFEIVSLTGTITMMNGEVYTHLHLSAGDDHGHVFGGHLNEGVVGPVCEMVIRVLDGEVNRVFDDTRGINVFDF